MSKEATRDFFPFIYLLRARLIAWFDLIQHIDFQYSHSSPFPSPRWRSFFARFYFTALSNRVPIFIHLFLGGFFFASSLLVFIIVLFFFFSFTHDYNLSSSILKTLINSIGMHWFVAINELWNANADFFFISRLVRSRRKKTMMLPNAKNSKKFVSMNWTQNKNTFRSPLSV